MPARNRNSNDRTYCVETAKAVMAQHHSMARTMAVEARALNSPRISSNNPPVTAPAPLAANNAA